MANYTEDDLQMLYDRRNDKTENPDRPWTVVGDDGKYNYYGNFDWYDYFYRKTRPEQEHNVSFTGGNEKMNYFVSGRYLTQDGLFNIYKDNYKNYSFRAKMNIDLTSRLRYSVNVNYNATSYKYAGYYDEQQTIHSLQSNILSSFCSIWDISPVSVRRSLISNWAEFSSFVSGTAYPPTLVREPPLICEIPNSNTLRRTASDSRVEMIIPV